ncbi:2-hydroxy-3-oxopropionate reductase [Kineosphaera limosa]|uniref:Putative oxidoreductase n=1 Tax=Kineosphaera limosa NBRC 100340 TaxID=1184609 RepID=K6W7F1_9MICO|nr:NAD(P)-dependent oxidoreductase [Kineosphaera limosa]NYE02987.1 2-hydroxy-3-oxopropionate reductase [Kineosphaera limosa]GAB95120.1 putative oxidoreductase [Kineosphaera limosa NBRC 100340]
MSEAVGVIGLGLMGQPVAANLAAAGHDVRAWNRRDVGLTDAEAHPVGGGSIRVVDDLADLGRDCPVVLSLLPDLPPLEALLPELLGEGSRVRTLVVMSTVSPVRVAEIARELAARGVTVVDAPMSGGVAGAQAGTLSIMIGGPTGAVTDLDPLFHCVGTTVVRLGDVGAGSLAKACNQMVVAGTLTALAEAMVLAERSGLDRAAVLDILGGGLAASEVLRQKADALATDDFTPSGPTRYLLKDLTFARDAAAASGTSLPQLEVLRDLFDTLVTDGEGDADSAVVLDTLRRISRPPAQHS